MTTFRKFKRFIKHNGVKVITFVLTFTLLCFSTVSASETQSEDIRYVWLGPMATLPYRGTEVAYPNDYKPREAELYYASGQNVVRQRYAYRYLDYAPETILPPPQPLTTWSNKLVNMGYRLDFLRQDTNTQNGFSLPLVTGFKWGFTTYMSDVTYVAGNDILFQSRLIGLTLKINYRLYDGTGQDSDVFPEKTITREFTEQELFGYMTTSKRFEQNWQVPTFAFEIDFDFSRPVLIQSVEVRQVFQLYSDFTKASSIQSVAPMLYQDVEEAKRLGIGSLSQALANLGMITDYSSFGLKGWYNTDLREEFIKLGTSADYSQYILDNIGPLPRLEDLNLNSSVEYAGGSLAQIGAFVVRLVSYPMVSAIVGAVLTLSLISAFIGVAVWYKGRRERK